MRERREVVVDSWSTRWPVLVDGVALAARRRPVSSVLVRHHVMSCTCSTSTAPTSPGSNAGGRGVLRAGPGGHRRCREVGEQVRRLYTAFGELVFDVWHRPSAQEYHDVLQVALPRAGLPLDLEDAMESDEHDAAMRASHDAGVALVGSEVGTPVTSIEGVAFYGPVLNAIPRGADADDVFEGARLLAGYPQFFELKRTRERPPVFT